MTDVRKIISGIGRSRLADALGCGPTAVLNAASRGFFPASWYPIVQRLATEQGVIVPDNLFNWRKPLDASDTQPPDKDAA